MLGLEYEFLRGGFLGVEYGGRHVNGVNITMPTGSMDPWHALGVVLSSGARLFMHTAVALYAGPKNSM